MKVSFPLPLPIAAGFLAVLGWLARPDIAAAAEPQKAVFAAGCFWCVEELYQQVPGVLQAVSGYAGGLSSNPTYEKHGDHAESVEVTFDPDKVSYEALVRIFFKSHDPTDSRGVAPDFGKSYRPILFYQKPEQLAVIRKVRDDAQKEHRKPIATEVLVLDRFWSAEDYHQDFVKRNPNHPYVRAVSLPRVRETLGAAGVR